ncbi:hypothetical protein [Rhodoferax sp.]|uniref:hypothetical protein n=1 Tax=Rhodoferax sp. TaxID=50421 RepID=UPI002852951F|nr:hypothetical protein [Rhodoferax sp.]
MSQDADPNDLAVPMFEILRSIGFGDHGNPHHFNIGTLFWSLTRLFGCYERIISTLEFPFSERPFLEADIENFIVRFRIVLNDIAYVLWQLLPQNARGLKGPKGGTHPKNKEVSIVAISDYLKANPTLYPELADALARAQPWISRLKNDRDNVVHYKSKALVFDTQPPSFALVNAAGTERSETTPDGGSRLVLEPIPGFVNGQLLALHNFMHTDLAPAIRAYAVRSNFKLMTVGWNERIRCIGTRTFKTQNGVVA